MAGEIRLKPHGSWAQVVIDHPGKFNAMSRNMWRDLRATFENLQQQADLRCVLVSGSAGHFCAGGDISEYPGFRFDAVQLRQFHEDDVWGGLQAMLDCDVPIVAQIEGNCMGAGVEIASCCDVRLATPSARFGAPIARLGFPMAAREAALVARAVGDSVARAMLLSAEVFEAARMLQCGFLTHCVAQAQLQADADALVQRQIRLAPQAARAHKRLFRALNSPQAQVLQAQAAGASTALCGAGAFAYADSPEHREGIEAFLQKRPPLF